ncbi:FecR family protein [Sphingomonas sp. PB4P5]|uniref:FecR family protein n=1 Tax=Parasphingomonas puruogangriensis TaxID=3096155 RepID=UPI002FC85300
MARPHDLDTQDLDAAVLEAVDWIVRLSSGDATEQDLRALATWRAARPEHDTAFRALAGTRSIGRAMLAEPRVSRRAMLAGGGSAMAAIVAIGLARPPLGLWPSFAEMMADHRTGPGQRYAFTPVAGVDVELNSRTSVALTSGGSGMRLINGETFVAVRRGAPFRLAVGEASVLATNASYNVETLAGGVRLVCLEGTIECRRAGTTSRLSANTEWRLNADGVATRHAIKAGESSSWRQGMLHFRDTPLSEVIEQFNRYRPVAIVLTDTSTGNRPVSGIFYTAEIDAAIRQLQQLLRLNIRTLPGDVLLIT